MMNYLGPAFTSTPDGHIETDIAAMGSLAGLMILQEAVPDLKNFVKPTDPDNIILAEVSKGTNEVMKLITLMLSSHGVKPEINPSAELLKEHQPLYSCQEMTLKLAPVFYELCKAEKISQGFYKYAAALTGYVLLMSGKEMNLINPLIGQNILYYYITAGSKTMPQLKSLWD